MEGGSNAEILNTENMNENDTTTVQALENDIGYIGNIVETNEHKISELDDKINQWGLSTEEKFTKVEHALEARISNIESSIEDIKSILLKQIKPKNDEAQVRNVKKENKIGKITKNEMSISDRIKIWHRKLDQNKVSCIGDFSFPAAKQAFWRLHRNFGLPEDLEKELSMLAFEKAALKIANGIAKEYQDESVESFWTHLETHLFNETQRRSQHSTFLGMRWNEKTESISKFAERVNVLGISLGYNKDLIQAAFIKGLPNRLQPYAFTTHGGFDELVSTMMHIVDSQKRVEGVRPVREVNKRAGITEEKARAEDLLGTENPEKQKEKNYKRSGVWSKERLANIQCYKCGEYGHMAWMTEECEKSRAQKLQKNEKSPKKGDGSGLATQKQD